MKSRANSSLKSSMKHLEAPVLSAFCSSPSNSSSCPISAQKAITSAEYFSLIHFRMTEVSSPPEYATTIFIAPASLHVEPPCHKQLGRQGDRPAGRPRAKSFLY